MSYFLTGADLLGFADTIGPGGQGLQQDGIEDSDDESLNNESDDEDDIGSEDDGEPSESDEDRDDIESPTAGRNAAPSLSPDITDLESESWRGNSTENKFSSSTIPASDPTSSGNKYVPPHMRAAMLEEKAKGDRNKAAELGKLERKAQGLLNK